MSCKQQCIEANKNKIKIEKKMHMKNKKLEGSDLDEKDPVGFSGGYLLPHTCRRDWNCTQRHRHDICFRKYSSACIRTFQKSFLKIILGT